MTTPQLVNDFWFGPQPANDPATLGPKMKRWFQGGPEFHEEVIAKFAPTTEADP